MRADDGSWEGECVWCPMLAAQYVFTMHLTGRPIPEDRQRRLLLQFERTRLESGVWGLHPHSGDYLFTTTLVYIAARLLGASPEASWLRSAREFFARERGVGSLPSWGKFWLCLLDLYDWRGIYPIPPELWLLPRSLGVHPSNFYCHTRLIYMGMAALYGARFRRRANTLIEEIRGEVWPQGYPRKRRQLVRLRDEIREEELLAPHTPTLKALYRLVSVHELVHRAGLRRRALSLIRERIKWEMRATEYVGLSPVNGFLHLLALWTNDPTDPDCERAFSAIENWIWEDDTDGTRVSGARSVCWDSAFALQALQAADDPGCEEPIAEGAGFLIGQQIRKPLEGHAEAGRIDPRGGWCFSAVGHGWPVSDCTAEALVALCSTSELSAEAAMEAISFLLRCQNLDGGFGSYERRKSRLDLGPLNPSEMFARCMTELSYVECTASCVEAIAHFERRFPQLVTGVLKRAKHKAVRFLRRQQNSDGSWPSAWGVNLIYGTMFGIRGLVAAGAKNDDPAVRRACWWLRHRQRPDGGWGEDPAGCAEGRYVAAQRASVIQTSWALIALCMGSSDDRAALERGADFLAGCQEETGEWVVDEYTGVFFQSALLDYRLYRQYFPVWALGLIQQDGRHRESARADRRSGGHAQ